MYKVIGSDGQEYQASSLDELKDWISNGSVGDQTLVSSPQGGGWKTASQYAELADCFRRRPPPPLMTGSGGDGARSRCDHGVSDQKQPLKSTANTDGWKVLRFVAGACIFACVRGLNDAIVEIEVSSGGARGRDAEGVVVLFGAGVVVSIIVLIVTSIRISRG